jgi:phenylalanyl-tRNA synthetase alpha chain
MPGVADITRQSLAELGVSTPAGVAERFDALRLEFDRATASARDEGSWKTLRDAWVGRKSGVLNRITEQWLKPAPPELKAVVGRHLNELRSHLEQGLEQLQQSIAAAEESAALTRERVDLSLPGVIRPIGTTHLIRQTF